MIEAELRKTFSLHPDARRVFIAYSGGLDSSALLHAAIRCAPSHVSLCAIHVHHGLSAKAGAWVEHCQETCAHLKTPLLVEYVHLDLAGKSLEEAAREARYAAFQKHLAADDLLLLAHHSDDQVETVVMRMLRGGDSALLSGIPAVRIMCGAHLVRPLLNVGKAQLERYAKSHRLIWIEDESNECVDITRNRLRQSVIPEICSIHPSFKDLVLELSNATAHINIVKQALASSLLPLAKLEIYDQELGLRLDVLSRLSQSAQEALVRAWLAEEGVPQMSGSNFKRVWSELIPAKESGSPEIRCRGFVVRRYLSALFITRMPGSVADGEGLNVVKVDGLNDATSDLELVRWDNFGKSTSFMGRKKKEWARQLRVAPWQRGRLLFAYRGGQALGVFDCDTGALLQY